MGPLRGHLLVDNDHDCGVPRDVLIIVRSELEIVCQEMDVRGGSRRFGGSRSCCTATAESHAVMGHSIGSAV